MLPTSPLPAHCYQAGVQSASPAVGLGDLPSDEKLLRGKKKKKQGPTPEGVPQHLSLIWVRQLSQHTFILFVHEKAARRLRRKGFSPGEQASPPELSLCWALCRVILLPTMLRFSYEPLSFLSPSACSPWQYSVKVINVPRFLVSAFY